MHERPYMSAKLVWSKLAKVPGLVKVVQVLAHLSEEGLVKGVFFYTSGVNFVANQH